MPIYITVITLFCLHVYLFLSFIPSVSAAEMASTLYNPTNVRNGRREREKGKKILMEMDAFERFVGINTAHIYLSTNSLLSGSHRLVLNIFIFTDVYGARRRRVQMSPSVNEKLHGSSSRVERRRDPCGENEQHPQRNGRVSLRRDRHVPHNVIYWISYYVGIIRLRMLALPAAPVLAIHVFFWVNGPSSGHCGEETKRIGRPL